MHPSPHNSRREFLQGRAAADAMFHLADGEGNFPTEPGSGVAQALSASDSATSPVGAFLLQLGRPAMACQFELYFNGREYPHATDAGMAALDLIEQLEDQLSVYRNHSEISRLNQTANVTHIPVEPGLFDLLALSLKLYRETSGAFDITASPLSRAWGFFRRAGQIPSKETLAEARSVVGSEFVELNPERKTVHFLKSGVELSLNSIGKGYALDRAADYLQCQGIGNFMFHGGQSSVLAAGANAGDPERGWSIGLRHPLRPEVRLAEFFLKDEALATSGTGRQHFVHQGKRYGHILDPRTGVPAEGVYSSTVIAPTAAEADALATAFYVLGPEEARQYCAERPHLRMMIVTPGKKQGTIEIHSQGLKEDSWRRCEE